MEDYDPLYAQTADYFGAGPDPLVQRFAGDLLPGGRVLDVGTGQGRNALPLARHGHPVTGIDPSEVAVAQAAANAARAGVTLDLRVLGFDALRCPTDDDRFDAALVLGLIQVLEPKGLDALFVRVREWLRPGGLLLLTGWHTGDPGYAVIQASAEPLGAGSYRLASGAIRTYLGPGEIRDRVGAGRDFSIVHHREALGPIHRHGDAPQEQHGVIELVARRIGSAAGP